MESAKLSKLMRGELDWIVMKALDKDRNRRYESASAFAADVQRYLNDEPVQAVPPSPGYRLRKFARRNKRALTTATLLAVALLVGILGTTSGMIRATRAEAEAVNEAAQKDDALKDKEIALSTARQSAGDARDQLFLALLNQARSGRFSRQMGQRLESLDALEKAARIRPDQRLADEATAALALPDIRRAPTLTGNFSGTNGYDFDGEYQTYARIDDQGIIRIRSVPENEEIRHFPIKMKGLAGNVRLDLSPDGQFVAVRDGYQAIDGQAHGYRVQLWRVADGTPVLREELQQCGAMAFSPNSRQAAVAKGDEVLCIDLASGEETSRWRLPAKAHSLAFHPNNLRLAVGHSTGHVASVYDSVRGTRVADLPVGSMENQIVAWHPDGTRLAVAGSDPRIQIWDVVRQRKLATLEGHVKLVTALSFHPDGSLLTSIAWEGVLRLWDPATGRQLMQLPLAAFPRFSSRGRYLGFLRQGKQVQLLEVTPCREYRTFVSSWGTGQGDYHDGAISPDGRLLALGNGRAGDRLWELSTGRELAVLPTASQCVLFRSDGRELLTCGETGVHRWPIRAGTEAAVPLRLGPPRKIALPFVPHRAARSPDGQTLAIVSEQSGAGLLVDDPTESVRGQPFVHPRVSEVALSRDGRWIASCGWHSDRVRLWNATTGTMVHEWVLGKQTGVFFTPDSRAVVISRDDAFTFWDVDTLQPIRRLGRDVALYPGFVAFSPDGKLMALEIAPAVVHLKEVATGRTVAKLEDPHGDRAGWMGFTPDGTQLVVAAPHAKAIHVWNLRAIRERLKGMGLDWNWPEFRPADPWAKAAEIVRAEVLPGDLSDPGLTPEQSTRRAVERFGRAVKANPDDAMACNALAWTYLTAPEPLRDVKVALPLAERAVRLSADSALYRNTLGLAYYRAGRYREAIQTLRPNLDKQEDWGLAYDLYFLAMSYAKLGETARARDYFDWAVRWSQVQGSLPAGHLDELRIVRAEAFEVMDAGGGVEVAPPPRQKK